MRIFISISLPDEILEEIKKIQENLPSFHGKKVEIENLHLTLKFLGEIDETTLENVKEVLSKINFDEFYLNLKEIGFFSEKIVRIIWVKLEGSENLQKEIDFYLKDLFNKEQRFMGHITIARVKNVDDKKIFIRGLKKIFSPKISFKVENFNLVESILTKKGPTYSILQNYPLEKENTSL